MAGTAGKVSHLQVCKVIHLQHVAAWFVAYQILQLILYFTIRIVVYVDAPYSILHHVFHNPVGCKNLSGRSYLVCIVLSLLGKCFILTVRDIELVEPTDEFRTGILLVGDKLRMINHIHKATVRQNVLRKQ